MLQMGSMGYVIYLFTDKTKLCIYKYFHTNRGPNWFTNSPSLSPPIFSPLSLSPPKLLASLLFRHLLLIKLKNELVVGRSYRRCKGMKQFSIQKYLFTDERLHRANVDCGFRDSMACFKCLDFVFFKYEIPLMIKKKSTKYL